MTEQSKENIKRWLLSSVLSFLTGFSLVLVLQIDDITLASLGDGSYVGILFAAVRAGLKALLESFLLWRDKGFSFGRKK